MSKILENAGQIHTLINGLVEAKEKGLIDHRESRQILTDALSEVQVILADRPGVSRGQATR